MAELRVALVAGPRVAESLRDACLGHQLTPDWSTEGLRQIRPHLLLIEAEGLRTGTGGPWTNDELCDLLEAARAEAIPSAVWVTDRELAERLPHRVLERADRVFAPDPATVELLSHKTTIRPAVLPHAAAAAAIRGGRRPAGGIAYVGGYSRRWSPDARRFVEDFLDLARPFGIRVVARTKAEARALPRRYRRLVHRSENGAVAAPDEPNFRVLVDFEPDGGVARAVFDALAAGVHVIAPRNHVAVRLLPKLTYIRRSVEDVAARAAWSMRGGSEQDDLADAGRRAVLNAHTYEHRLATIAASLGYPVMPDGSARR
jgi:hypothetical protein